MKIPLVLLLVIGLVSMVPVMAQDAPLCPPDVLLALARSGSACFGLEHNQVCYGNGTVTTAFFPGNTSILEKAGDISGIAPVQRVATEYIDKGISTALLDVQANLTEAEERGVFLLLYGSATLENSIPPLIELTGYANGGLNIRRTPEMDGEIITKMAINQAVTANGRTQDGDWLWVRIPNSNDLGWAGAEVITLTGDAGSLAVVGVDERVFRPFQHLTLINNETTFCDGALPSGLLLQTPNPFTPVAMQINGAEMRLTGTFFLQATDTLIVYALDGQGEISADGKAEYIPAGAVITVPLDDGWAKAAPTSAEPYLADTLRALPVNNLPLRVQAAPPLTLEEIAAKREAFYAVVEATSEAPIAAQADTSCKRIARRDTTTWAGPGDFYEAVNDLTAGTRLLPTLQTTDPDGNVWWQLNNTNWMAADDALQTGECEAIPVMQHVPPPRTNTLSLETCKTTNGPLRAGQQVTIEFIPQAFENSADAYNALKIDPGRIKIDEKWYRTQATDPIVIGSVGGERYIRRFYITWEAKPGTYRIDGDRLHYSPSCTVTVPVG